MQYKYSIPAIAFLAAVASFPSSAGAEEEKSLIPGEFSANVGFTTDYVFRGVTQADEGPAVQGGFDWSHESGVYAGVWGSNVDFNDGDEASVEIDYYVGFANEIDAFSYDVGLIYYSYPGAADSLNYDFYEVGLNMGYDFGPAAISAGVSYSPENFGDSGNAVYYQAGVSAPLPKGFGVDAHVGHQEIDDEATFGLPDYNDWSVGLTYNFEGFDLDLRYIDTDLGTDCGDGCDAKGVFTISRSF